MSKPNKKYSISLTAKEWKTIAECVFSGQMEMENKLNWEGSSPTSDLSNIQEEGEFLVLSIQKFSSQIKY